MNLQLTMPFNLDISLCCGQVFRWEKRGDWWFGVVGDRVVKIRQIGETLDFSGTSGVDETFIRHYFSLDHDLEQIKYRIGKDERIKGALEEFWGLRLIRQSPLECLISFICATYKNVPAIQQMLLRLSSKFGERLTFEGYKFYAFPLSKRLAGSSLEELKKCGLGYRAPYIQQTSHMIFEDDYNLENLRMLSYEQAREKLLEFPGVGLKVADCTLLFSLDKLIAFPVDVWVKRILLRYYTDCFEQSLVKKLIAHDSLSDSDYKQLNGFGRAYFGEFAGYAQEYLYHQERWLRNRKLEKG
ncbi:MAG TPA: DNA glycosylase [Candidatus Sulfotelmatobacter sp.]|nr:DNA glycosylase [Candidatus Sulfotelmatobacter sp.]